MKVLVTGGLGYIGSHTVVELINAGHQVVIIDNLSNSSRDVLNTLREITGEETPFHRVDITDHPHLNRVFVEYKDIDHVIHFAACKSVGESMKDPEKYYSNNVCGTLNLLQVMKHHDVKNLIFSSSCTVYGQADELPITENTPIKPAESVYGRTKQICEGMITDFHHCHEYNSVLLRYFNPIGSHESGLIGDNPNGVPNNLLPYVVQTASGKRDQITVHGTDYDTPDGTAIRDYIHVVDLARAHVKAVEKCNTENFKATPINLGTGAGYSVKQVLDTFQQTNDVELPIVYGPRRDGDITAAYADTSLSSQVLDWSAELTLEDMVRSAWLWELSNCRKKD